MTEPVRHRERVDLPGRETDVWIGAGIRELLATEVRRRFPRAERVGWVIDANVHALWPLELDVEGLEIVPIVAPPGEAAKRRAVLAEMQDQLLDLRRDEPVVAVGGGAVLDVAGFAAATVRRGLPWVGVPTTVIGMADASVGGKVAVNHARGKNLLGSFHPPALVLADPAFLETLDAREITSGLAELYKVGRIGDARLLALLAAGEPVDPRQWVEVLARAVAVKARIVEADERDAGRRRLLNYGHTIGHALERLLGPDRMRHGEGVAIGMSAAARIARARAQVDAAWVDAQDRDLERLGLETAPPSDVEASALLEAVALDKKRRPGRRHVFVLPREEGDLEVVEDVEDREVMAAWS